METFSWAPQLEPAGEIDFKTLRAQFGDGYSQLADDGINSETEVWSLSFRCDAPTSADIEAFLRRHRKSVRFLWTPPGGKQGTYLASSFQKVPMFRNGPVHITVKFELAGLP
ncbi:phage-related protein [Herbaspirillum seropedicae]|uniref:phage tail protein n=1 Tax=Herbaspirillum seropedicae TaxID=964 RepID=UPI0033963B16